MDQAQANALNAAIRAISLRHRARAAELLTDLGPYPGQEYVLTELVANGPQIQAQLAAAIGCEPPRVTLMVRKLEAAGYVARRPSPNDRRASVVELTAQGHDAARTLERLWSDLADETVAGISRRSLRSSNYSRRWRRTYGPTHLRLTRTPDSCAKLGLTDWPRPVIRRRGRKGVGDRRALAEDRAGETVCGWTA
jgi:DNA-binding MarR family transcriptional regulator